MRTIFRIYGLNLIIAVKEVSFLLRETEEDYDVPAREFVKDCDTEQDAINFLTENPEYLTSFEGGIEIVKIYKSK